MKKFISMLLAGLLLIGLYVLAGCSESGNSAEIDALKKQIATPQQQIQDTESGSLGYRTADCAFETSGQSFKRYDLPHCRLLSATFPTQIVPKPAS